jgi:hypothetical protein
MSIEVSDKTLIVSCYICGKKSERLLHPDELRTGPFTEGCILCNYCHRPVCLAHLSPEKIKRLLRIRPQHFCVRCGEDLIKTPLSGYN